MSTVTTATTTASRVAGMIVPQLRMAMGYAEKLVADIPADRFAHCPAPNINHPAWCIGHLSIYPERTLELLGRADLAKHDTALTELFKAGSPCVEQDGRYPTKDAIVRRYMDRWSLVASTLPSITDERCFEPNPLEGRMRELLPTLGAMLVFVCGSHHMMHLGQISTWRRLVGLGSVM